jgi:hypothetical protein
MLMDHFGMDDSTKSLAKNGHRDDQVEGGPPDEELGAGEAKVFRMLAARLNFMVQDNLRSSLRRKRSAARWRALRPATSRR